MVAGSRHSSLGGVEVGGLFPRLAQRLMPVVEVQVQQLVQQLEPGLDEEGAVAA